MKTYIIHKGSNSSGFNLKPHWNKKNYKQLVKIKDLNTYQDFITDQRDSNNLFGLSYGLNHSVGISFNLKEDSLYLYGYSKSNNYECKELLSKCKLDTYYYLEIDVLESVIEFSVYSFRRKVKDKLILSTPNESYFPLGLITYPQLSGNSQAPISLKIIMGEYTNSF